MELEISGIKKAFPGVLALDNVSLRLRGGEIQALMGENGAGKSTLIKILTGVYRPEAGKIVIDGKEAHFGSPRDALNAGISVVHQERNLITEFSVAENIALENLPTRGPGWVDYKRVNRDAQKWLKPLGLDVKPTDKVKYLSVAQMQLIEVAKALSLESQVLLLDEPTASITPHETTFLFNLLRRLRDQGVAILFVSHKLEEIFELCDRVTILRDGRNTALDSDLKKMSHQELVTLMIGRDEMIQELPPKKVETEQPALEVRNLSTEAGVKGINFSLYPGEILGLYGLIGAGRTELARGIFGADKITSGDILIEGKSVQIKGVRNAVDRHRLGYVSENRKEEGLILTHSIISNISITVWPRVRQLFGWIRDRAEKEVVEPYVQKLQIKTPSIFQTVGNLSGGNQQKVSLSKWLAADVKVLIIDEPTVGIDIKTKNYFHELIWELASRGLAILLISSDMPEMVRLADRIMVMRNKTMVGEIKNNHRYEEISQKIGELIT